ncbi:MAG TPA: hypothetical protein VJW94_03520 [Candidatus Acidoferrum sp.]|nr:hypothetical protein [Candidatus Acidoferrum sp.]
MIHLALEVLAFLFLCWVGWYALMVAIVILSAIGDALGKLFTPSSRPPSSKNPFALRHYPLKPNHNPRTCSLCLAGGYRDDLELYARAPRGMSTDELNGWVAQEREREQERKTYQIEAPRAEIASERERQIEAIQRDFSSSLRDSTPEELASHDPRTCPLCLGGGHPITVGENQQNVSARVEPTLEDAREAFHGREAERRDPLATKEREAALDEERKRREDEKREQEAREFLSREAVRVLREREEREEREAAEKREREAGGNRTRWIH